MDRDLVALVVATAAVMLGGWTLGFVPAWAARGTLVMLPMTALSFLCGGLALWLRRRPDPSPAARWTAHALTALMLALAGAALFERLTGRDLGVDLLLFRDAVTRLDRPPHGRMAANTALCFLLAGAALLCLDRPPRRLLVAQGASLLGSLSSPASRSPDTSTAHRRSIASTRCRGWPA